MARYIPDEVEAYAERYTTARADVFDRLGAETKETQDAPQMMVGTIEGAFLSFLVAMTQAVAGESGGRMARGVDRADLRDRINRTPVRARQRDAAATGA